MPAFLPLTPEEERKALAAIGIQTIEDLFASIPPKIREQGDFDFDTEAEKRGLTEHELRDFVHTLANKNGATYRHFLGGGVYDNILPSAIDPLVSRGEFLTCYTPYQPEISQGTLQAIFEFQTMICRITQMEVANASMYDGATATAEAILMAQRISRGKLPHVLMAASTHPDYREVAQTFLQSHSNAPVEVKWGADGSLDLDHLQELMQSHPPYALVVPSPNYFGVIEPIDQIRALLPESCLLIVTVADASALSVFEPPGRLGADIVVGEAHQLGTPMTYGGPHVGFFATKKKHLRQMPGRLSGETVDSKGKRAYALTLAAREQHIRRERATSNICTNQGLIALRTTIYLSLLGKRGFEQLGETNYSLFQYLAGEMKAHGLRLMFSDGLHYREGVFQIPNLERRFQAALAAGIVPGIRLATRSPVFGDKFEESLLICAHPKQTKEDIDQLVEVLSHG